MTDTKLTLWDIDEALHGLLLMREEEGLSDDERKAIDGQIQLWADQHLAKVDRIAAYLKHAKVMEEAAKQEAERLRAKAAAWESRARRLKEIVMGIMELRGKKRLEGNAGLLRIQANGGKRALKITRPDLLPEEYLVYRGVIRSNAWGWLRSQLGSTLWEKWSGRQDVQMDRVPLEDAVRKALENKCEVCGGSGEAPHPNADGGANSVDAVIECSACKGTGGGHVPGAELEERGQHLRVE